MNSISPMLLSAALTATFQFGEAGRTSNRFGELGHVWLSDARLDCRHDRVERLRRDYAEALDLYVCDRHIVASRHFAAILGLSSLHSIRSEGLFSTSIITIEPLRSTSLARAPNLEIEDGLDRRDVGAHDLQFFPSVPSLASSIQCIPGDSINLSSKLQFYLL
jgi:hypothetical protein